ncbi:MAG: YggS family pyridoxal phosphate-dependent enzyme [Prevotella sp.]|nr:YggS family pyridoxal phosphate-dependent enzyme [Prevotella sp.]
MIADNLQKVKDSLSAGVELVAVSKYHPVESVKEAYAAGQRVFGESREQELRVKHETLPKDIQWHFIGHLQTNKVKYIAPYIAMIEAVDSLKLLQEINRQAEKCNRVIDVLLELHLAQESTKSGMLPEECFQMLEQGEWRSLKHVRIRGIMMMASNTDDTEQIRKEFLRAQDCFDCMKQQFFADDEDFNVRSYGMSGDYLLAQQCGSNHVRVGSMIFS